MEKITINKQEAEIIAEMFLLLVPVKTTGEFENLKLKINKFLKKDRPEEENQEPVESWSDVSSEDS